MALIADRERLIFALDVADARIARTMVEELGDAVHFYKLGLELFTAGGYFELVKWLKRQQKKVFADLKLFDVPQTVAGAVARLSEQGVDLITVHGNQGMMEAAASVPDRADVVAVTVLTSLDEGDLKDLGFSCDVESLVLSRARRAMEAGLEGVVASGQELRRLRAVLGDKLLVVTPGIRPVTNREADDQKRVVTPATAIRAGADHLVVGRPIRDAQRPRLAAIELTRQIKKALSELENG